ncbi:hypothetical protein P8452_68450 [Trifolium repens]|nr:hypothetical protein P8452_68450 [Trifolium repens]
MASSLLLPFLLYSLIIQSICVVAQTKSTIAIGDSFTATTSTSPWLLSPSGDFAFGFLPLKNTTDIFFLSIWYAKILDKTVVWYANGDSPAPQGSKVELTANDGLVLTSPNGDGLWNTTEVISDGVIRGVLNDTGNFVLENANSKSVWETFKFPSDTLLPSQVVEKGGNLSSRLKETNFSKGRFELLLQGNGDLVMRSINLPSGYVNKEAYYLSNTTGETTSSAGTQLVFDRSGYLYILGEKSEKFNLSEVESNVSTTDFYLRATLNFDGVFILYKHPKSSTETQGWTTVWSQPDNICSYVASKGSGVCGYNSFCTLGDDKRPTCQCPNSYSLVDPDDPYGSCKPDFIQGCAEDELSKNRNDLYDFKTLNNTDWPESDFVLQQPFTEEQCKEACLEDCLCSVAIFRFGNSCWKKKLPLANGRFDVTRGSKAFLKVRKDKTSLVIKNNNRKTLVLVGSVLFGSSAILNIVLIVATCVSTSIFQFKKKLRRVIKSDTCVEIESNLRCFTYEELEEATNGFEKELGRGAFVLLEIISCRRCVKEMDQEDEEKAILTDWAYDCYKEGSVDALVEGDNEALEDKVALEKLIMIAIWCVQEDPYLRPTMRNVLLMLEGTVEVQVPPCPSPISIEYSIN